MVHPECRTIRKTGTPRSAPVPTLEGGANLHPPTDRNTPGLSVCVTGRRGRRTRTVCVCYGSTGQRTRTWHACGDAQTTQTVCVLRVDGCVTGSSTTYHVYHRKKDARHWQGVSGQ
eukprot:2226864-Prymnesium_polylepis.1